jgi:hypothetical protein
VHLPRRWSLAELQADAGIARERFRANRLDEPLDLYIEFFDAFVPVFDQLVGRLEDLGDDSLVAEQLADIMANPNAKIALRYLTAPPISEDDLKTLADARLSAGALRRDTEAAKRVRDIVLHVIDPRRFPWIAEQRLPTRPERERAIIASAALAAAQRVQTKRRNDAKKEQEQAVSALLVAMGLTELPARDIPFIADAPEPGCFCRESQLGPTRADVVIGLFDRRVLAIECKVSNSEVNSFKRVNHEAAGKATTWLNAFGAARQVVPAAVLSGVFKPQNLDEAQGQHLHLFWSHRLADLRTFVRATGR